MLFCSSWKELHVQQNSLQKHQNSNEPERNCKGLLHWPVIVVTSINNLGTIGTWCSSPSHIIHSIHSSAVLSLFSFGALSSLCSSLTNRSSVSFRTRRAWEWLPFAWLACFSWKQKDLLEKQCNFFLSRRTIKNRVFKIPNAQSFSGVVLLLRRFS